ncbi:4Fe-4S binding protein [Saccharicrinis sp. GN24d3]|uniref:4Fe-4S binding protein n=1 Tax=Saccharicrinis sp. GN24d3 TaxID=3458416 RepID=UPI00403701A9
MKKFFTRNGIRSLIQMSILGITIYWLIKVLMNPELFVDFEKYCPMGGIQSLFTFLENGALACTMSGMQLILGVALLVCVLLFSKLFCSFICPLGTVSEWFGKLGRKLKIQFTINDTWDKVLRIFKYALLSITFYYTLSSNELFCKAYDPFFAIVSRFGHDVIPWLAIAAIAILAIGSIIIPMFWCRYVCPLGAISTLFKHIYVVIALVVIYLVIYLLKIEVSWIYLLIILFIAGYFFEAILPERSKSIQMMKITRNTDSCIDCNLCSKKCPQGIDVASLEVVNHSDCNLCGDCVGSCPVSNTLLINNKNSFRWMPILALAVFVLGGIYLGSKLELPTVDIKWGTEEEVAKSEYVEYSGLKNVKCYGSSMSFVGQMKTVKGTTGAATYTNSHTVKVWYDTTATTGAEVKKALFSPVRVHVKDGVDSLKYAIVDAKVYNFFDQMDVFYLDQIVRSDGNILSFESSFGEPVNIRFYADYNINTDSLRKSIERKYITLKSGGKEYQQSINFKVSEANRTKEYVTGIDLKRGMFMPYKRTCNNYKSYPKDQIVSFEMTFDTYPRNEQMMQYVINSVAKKDTAVVGMVTYYKSEPTLRVYFVKDKTDPQEVANLITAEKLTITYDNGVVEEMDNPYTYR